MSDDEVIVFLVAMFFAIVFLAAWLVICKSARNARVPKVYRRVACTMPLICLVAILIVLRTWASFDVRDSVVYTLFYLVIGAAWVGVGSWVFPFMGISLRDDVMERRNGAALWAICGALLGLSFCYAGANIGDGPGWWVVFAAGFISTVTWFVCWSIYQAFTHVADHVTVDRDTSAGIRLGGFLTAIGIVLGRAVAGDWESIDATLVEFVKFGWPALPLLVAAIVFEKLFRPTPQQPSSSPAFAGFIPVLLYLLTATLLVAYLGPGN